MIWRLRQRGFTVVSKDDWFTSGNYHLISALNLIDRHYNPSLLLSQIHSLASRSNSLVLIAVVLPFHQYVEFHPSRDTNRPGIYRAHRVKNPINKVVFVIWNTDEVLFLCSTTQNLWFQSCIICHGWGDKHNDESIERIVWIGSICNVKISDSIIVLKGETFEEQASSLMNDVFVPAGFHLLKWGKLPYLCEGDSKRV